MEKSLIGMVMGNKFKIKKKIGKGSFGEIYKGSLIRDKY